MGGAGTIGLVGLLAGLSGIGGGIFMAPVLHLIRWAEARRIAAFASLYILVNSITGLAGQLAKGGWSAIAEPLTSYWPLVAAVFIGGQLGSWLGLKILSPTLAAQADGFAGRLRRVAAALAGDFDVRKTGSPGGIRTPDQSINSRLLYH